MDEEAEVRAMSDREIVALSLAIAQHESKESAGGWVYRSIEDPEIAMRLLEKLVSRESAAAWSGIRGSVWGGTPLSHAAALFYAGMEGIKWK